jgi:hypothetical protein
LGLSAVPERDDEPGSAHRAPLWLRGLILFVVLWLGVRIVGNVTDSLRGMVGRAPAPVSESASR